MIKSEEVAVIDAQIQDLHEKRKVILTDCVDKARVKLRDLSWCNGMEVTYYPGSSLAGLPAHQLYFYSQEPLLEDADFGPYGFVMVYGEHNLYEYNIVVRHRNIDIFSSRDYKFDTSDPKVLCEFIEVAGLKVKMEKDKVHLYETLLEHRVR